MHRPARVPIEAPLASAAELRRGTTRVRVDATDGAPISAFVAGEVDWCAAGPWVERAPTAAACMLPTYVQGVAGAQLPEGGLLASDPAEVVVHAPGGANALHTRWRGTRYPLEWSRVVLLDADGGLELRYEVGNPVRHPVPFIWSLHLPLEWSDSTVFAIPRGARARIAQAHGVGLPPAGSEFAWPAMREGGRLVDLSTPTRFSPRASVNCYVELPQGKVTVHAGACALEIAGDSSVVTHARVFIDNDADDPSRPPRRWWRRRTIRRRLSIAPSIGAPDQLSEAVGAWRSARWIDAGASFRWTLRARVITPTT